MIEWDKYKSEWDKLKENIYYTNYITELSNFDIKSPNQIIEFRRINTNWKNWMDYVKIKLISNPPMNQLYYKI